MDGSIFYAKDTKMVDKVILSLKYEFLLERAEDLAGFLVIQIRRTSDDITLKQTGLIEMILHAMIMKEHNVKYTLVDKDSLSKDTPGVPSCEEWGYR